MTHSSSADDLRHVQEHFEAIIDRSPAERREYLDRVLADEPRIREAVERLLRASDDIATGFLDDAISGAARAFAEGSDRTGLQLGSYRLVRELGRGGMGTVWLAERIDDSFSAQVAIKLVRGGFADPEMERRFRAERQILADLRHPNIARLLDGGTAPDGTPFFVMEYVDGVPVTRYADTGALDVRRRLTLFRQVCDAVQYAHASLIVHRDIKPSNILVGADGVPKLMDFGIAKPLEAGASIETAALERPMTPAYASPEQVRGERITVATDVYALGMLLYELLTGSQPFASDDASPMEVQRRVLEDEARAPSNAITGATYGRPNRISARELAGDLDNIVGRAIAKEPDRRYASVADLSEDIRRHLDGEPVAARAPTFAYRFGKFVRRRRVEVTIAATALLLLTGFSAYYTARLARERDVATLERNIAERERRTAEQVSDFLANMFWSADPGQTLGDTVTARELLARGRERLDTALVDAPAVRARMLATLGIVHYNLAQYADARSLLERSISVMDSTEAASVQQISHGTSNRDSRFGESAQRASAEQSIQPLRTLAAVLSTMGQRDSALIVGQRSIVAAREAADSTQLVLALMALGDTYGRAGQFDSALEPLTEALHAGEAAWGPEAPELARVLESLGSLRIQRREYDEGRVPAQRALAIRRQHLDARDPALIGVLGNLGIILWQTGQVDSARTLFDEALAIGEATYGPVHPRVIGVRVSLAQILSDAGEYDAAIAEMKAGLAADEQLLPPGNPRLGIHSYNIGLAHRQKGDLAGALPWLERAVDVMGRSMPPDNAAMESPYFQLGVTLHELDRPRDALEYFQRARTVIERNHPENSPRFVRVFMAMGSTYDRLGDAESAFGLLTRAVTMQEEATGPDNRDLTFPLNNLAAFHMRHGNFPEAVRHYERSVAIMRESRADDLEPVLREYARALRATGDSAKAATIEAQAGGG